MFPRRACLCALLLPAATAGTCGLGPEACVEEELAQDSVHEVALLQLQLGITAAGEQRELAAAAPALGGRRAGPAAPDVPEASWGWALFQNVTGPSQALAATSDEPLPGERRPDQAQTVNASDADLYYSPSPGPLPPDSPSWVFDCLGNRSMGARAGNILVGVSEPQLIPFVAPQEQHRTDAAVVVMPGGGGDLLAWEEEGTDVAKWLNSVGVSAFVLKYRIPMATWGFLPGLMDAQRAVSLVRSQAASLGLNASRVGLFGASYGGFLALHTTFARSRTYAARDWADGFDYRPSFLLLNYPAVPSALITPAPVLKAVAALLPDEPLMGNLGQAPPIFMAGASDDGCCDVDRLLALHKTLRWSGAPTLELNVYPDGGHSFSMCYRRANGLEEMRQYEACMWMVRAERFITLHVLGRAPPDVDPMYQQLLGYDQEDPSFITLFTKR